MKCYMIIAETVGGEIRYWNKSSFTKTESRARIYKTVGAAKGQFTHETRWLTGKYSYNTNYTEHYKRQGIKKIKVIECEMILNLDKPIKEVEIL